MALARRDGSRTAGPGALGALVPAFKLTFLSGITKILSGDRTWANWTALTYHYETQPIPAWTSWYAHQLPASVHYWSTAGMFGIELLVPWVVFLPPRFRRVRAAAAALMASLQAGIAATGNYGFFNLLTIVLYLALLDDGVLAPPKRRPTPELRLRPTNIGALWQLFASGAAMVIGCCSVMTAFREIDVTWGRPSVFSRLWSPSALAIVAPLDSINGYGLFRVMTTERPEIVIEASADGDSWKEYEFRWKTGDVRRGRRSSSRTCLDSIGRCGSRRSIRATRRSGSAHWSSGCSTETRR